jgi:hypothetical protein
MREWIAETAMNAFGFMLPVALIALGIAILLLPFAAFKTTRAFAGVALTILSYVFGATAWLYGAACSFAAFGWVGLIIGLVFAGIGVVPLAMIAGIFKADVPIMVTWILLALVAATLLARITGMAIMAAPGDGERA